MNGPYFFGTGRGAVSDELYERVSAAIADTDSDFVRVTLPGEGPRYWFEAPNRGSPFDARAQAEVDAVLRSAGVLDDDGRLDLSIGAEDDE